MNYKFTQTEYELITEIDALKEEIKTLREAVKSASHISVENKRMSVATENQRLKCLFRFACEVLARNDFELDADGHKLMIERLYDDTQAEAQ